MSGKGGQALTALKAAFPHTIPILTGFLVLGTAHGVLMKVAGFSWWWPLLTSVAIFGGSLEFVATSLLQAPFAPLLDQSYWVAGSLLGGLLGDFLPFAVFSSGKPVPRIVSYLGKALPPAIFSMLVVYCLSSVDILAGSHGIPELLAVSVTAGVHLWKRQTLLSIIAGTACYMLLLQLVF